MWVTQPDAGGRWDKPTGWSWGANAYEPGGLDPPVLHADVSHHVGRLRRNRRRRPVVTVPPAGLGCGTMNVFALLLTWTCYGTWLPGDPRGSTSHRRTPDGDWLPRENDFGMEPAPSDTETLG